VGWILLTFLGVFGVHRMYQGKWITGILYLFTGGLFFIGVLYDFWTLKHRYPSAIARGSERGREALGRSGRAAAPAVCAQAW